MSPDWNEWHHKYNTANGKFAQRLATTQALLTEILDGRPPGPITLIDVCAGQGRVTLPIIRTHPRGADVYATLIDSNAECCDTARVFAAEHALAHVTVIHGDAGLSDSYMGLPRADVVIFSGVVRYLSRRDLRRTAKSFRQVCAPSAALVWTHGETTRTSIETTRQAFDHAGFREIALRDHGGSKRPGGVGFVGEVRLITEPDELVAGRRWFRFSTRPIGVKARVSRIRRAVMRRIRRLT